MANYDKLYAPVVLCNKKSSTLFLLPGTYYFYDFSYFYDFKYST